MKKKKTLVIDRKEFLEWYFDGYEYDTLMSFADIVIASLELKGSFSVQDMWNRSLGFIDVKLIQNKDVINEKHIITESPTDEGIIENPSKKYNVKFV